MSEVDMLEGAEQTSAIEQSEQAGTTTQNVSGEQTQTQEPAVTDEWLIAPKAYRQEFQEPFKALSPEFRKYLHEREKQTEKGFSELGNKLNGYKWADDAYVSRQERLGSMGFKDSREYIEHLTAIDDAMEKDPFGTLTMLAQAYGVDLNNNNTAFNSLQRQFGEINQRMAAQEAFIKQQQDKIAADAFNAFINAKDESGNSKYPYFEDVKQDMVNLFKNKQCTSYEQAYKMATLANDDIRQKILDAQVEAKLKAKAEEASKAKGAAFEVKSKQAATPSDNLTTRQALEKKARELNIFE